MTHLIYNQVRIVKKFHVTMMAAVFILLQATVVFASQQNTIKQVTLKELTQIAATRGIHLINMAGLPETQTYTIQAKALKDRELLARQLKVFFVNSFVVTGNGGFYDNSILILPANFNPQAMEEVKEYASKDDIKSRLAGFNSANRIPAAGILKQPEIKALNQMAAQEKEATLHFDRIVNPAQPAGAYSFRVRYNKDLNMFLPFQKNGQSIAGQMEGFTSFNSVARFIRANQANLVGRRSKDALYLQLKQDSASVMMLKKIFRRNDHCHPRADG